MFALQSKGKIVTIASNSDIGRECISKEKNQGKKQKMNQRRLGAITVQ